MGTQIQNQLLETYRDVLASLISWTPRILMAILLVALALLVAKLFEKGLRSTMVRLKFDSLLARVGTDQALHRIGIRESLNSLVPRLVYYLLLVLFARTAADAMGLVAISNSIGAFMAYVPNIVAALLILMIGSAAAQFAGRATSQAAANSGIEFAASLGGLVTGLLLFVIGMSRIVQFVLNRQIFF